MLKRIKSLSMWFFFLFFLPLLTITFWVRAQEDIVPKPKSDEFYAKFFVSGIKSKEDVLKIEQILRENSEIKFFRVNDFPAKDCELVAKKSFSPSKFNTLVSSHGFSTDLSSFTDPRELEENLAKNRLKSK